MVAFGELYLTSILVLFPHISGQWSGNATIKHCGSSDLTITFNFSLGGEIVYRRTWFLNSISISNKIADINKTGFLTVEPPYTNRLTVSGKGEITLSHVNNLDSGRYLLLIATDASFIFLTATTTVIINEIPNASCIPLTANYINSITCEIPAACPGKGNIQASWNDGSIGWLRCPLVITKYNCCAVGDPVNNCYNGSLCTETECKDGSDPGSIHLSPNRTSHELTELSSLNVNCSADCFPECQYTWTGPGGNNVSSTGLLSFIAIGRNQSGQYTCTASDSDSPIKRATSVIRVTVFYGPDDRNVSLSPSNTLYQLTELSRLDVKCSATCEPRCHYQWSGPLVSHNDNMGWLSISQIQRDQNGSFACTVTNPKNPGKSATANFSLIVYYGPDANGLTLSPSNTSYQLIESSSFTVQCTANCVPQCNYQWIGPGISQNDNRGLLNVSEISRNQSGTFTCTVTNPKNPGKSVADSFLVIVYYPPVLTMKASNTSKGGRVVINCTASGVPDNYKFYKLTHKAPDESRTIVRELELTRVSNRDVSLTIEGATYQDTGLYVCKASNGIAYNSSGQLVMEDMVFIWITDQPVITSNTNDFVAEKGTSGQMYLEFYSGLSQSRVTWYIEINGTMELLQNSSNVVINLSEVTVEVKYYQMTVRLPGYNASLVVFDVAEAHFTSYKVEINNGLQEPVIVTLQLNPRGPPETPANLTVVPNSVTTNSLQLSWRAGFHGGASQTFVIEYREAGQTDWLNKTEPRGLVLYIILNTTIADLKDGTNYEFRIYSENVYNRSQISPVINETTKIVMKDELVNPNRSPVVIGAATGSALVLVIAIVIVGFYFNKRRQSINTSKKGLVDNPVYNSSGPLHDKSTNGSDTGVEYAAVVKPNKKGGQVDELNVYAQVNKTKDGKKKGDIYENATPAGRHNLNGNMYENSELKADENIYENPSEKAPKESLAKKDGLLYAELALDSPTTTNGKYVIRGLENHTQYADIAKRGEPLPDNEKET